MQRLISQFPGRKTMICTILSLMGEPSHWVTPSIYMYGHSGTGKTSLIKSIMEVSMVPFAYVDALECHSLRILYETILNQLSGVKPSLSNNYVGYEKCDNMLLFIEYMTQMDNIKDKSVYIIIDNIESLNVLSQATLPAFLRLSELTKLNLCVITIGRISWESYCIDNGIRDPLLLYFNQYSKNEILQILSQNWNTSDYPESFHITYLTHVWNVVNTISRNIEDLCYISELMFPLYCEPITNGLATASESKKLWNSIEPYFRKLLVPLLQRDRDCETFLVARQTNNRLSLHSYNDSIDCYSHLPLVVKFLVIASYLASYNPPASDKRFFSKRKHRKSKKRIKLENNQRSLGPRPYPLERMMAIFHSITTQHVLPTQLVYCQITTLVDFKFIVKVGASHKLDTVKYKCLVTFEAIKELSKSVDFEIVRYLQDYN